MLDVDINNRRLAEKKYLYLIKKYAPKSWDDFRKPTEQEADFMMKYRMKYYEN